MHAPTHAHTHAYMPTSTPLSPPPTTHAPPPPPPTHPPTPTRAAMIGTWKKGPGVELFQALEGALGEIPIMAEDLGVITPDVTALRKAIGAPGMCVLQFAWGGGPANTHLPHNVYENCFVYPGEARGAGGGGGGERACSCLLACLLAGGCSLVSLPRQPPPPGPRARAVALHSPPTPPPLRPRQARTTTRPRWGGGTPAPSPPSARSSGATWA